MKSEPGNGLTVLHLINNAPCRVNVWLNPSSAHEDYSIDSNAYLTLPALNFKNQQILAKTENCTAANTEWRGTLNVTPTAYQTASISIGQDNSLSVSPFPFKDDFEKSKDGNARVKFVVSRDNIPFKLRADEGPLKVSLTPDKGNGASEQYHLSSLENNVVFSDTEEVPEAT